MLISLGKVVGKSAYELAVVNGYVGTETQWLASLKGDIGPQGPKGDTDSEGSQGPKGDTGERGIQGIQGLKGDTGNAGADGKTILSGTTAPVAGTGTNGDFYLNTATSMLYGPKASGAWPIGKTLVGTQGTQGLKGDTGTAGSPGLKGDTGPVGPAGIQGIQGITGPASTTSLIESRTSDPASPVVGQIWFRSDL